MRRFFAIIVILATGCAEIPAPHGPVTVPRVTGTVQLAFEGTFGDSTAGAPDGLSFGLDGALYACDRDRGVVLRINPAGVTTARFGGTGSRSGERFLPIDIGLGGGIEVYVLDSALSRVLRFDRNLKNDTTVYRPDPDNPGLFGSFAGIAFDIRSGDIYLADRDRGAVVRVDMLAGSVRDTGSFGSAPTVLNGPAGLDVTSDGTVMIADTAAGTMALMRRFGTDITVFGSESLTAPRDVAVIDSSTIAVADRDGIVIMNLDGLALGVAGYGIDRTMRPLSVAWSNGRVFVSDDRSGTILVYRLIRE